MFCKMVNDLHQDPLLAVGFDALKDMVLLDCGYMFGLTLREVQRISSIFVSHTHFDHFMGFDHFLRLCIEQKKTVELYGPRGFIENVRGKLAAYNWNLSASLGLDFLVFEIDEPGVRQVLLKGSEGYGRLHRETFAPFDGLLKSNEIFRVSAAVLDHKIPSLAFSVKERDFFSVRKEALAEMGLRPGPWIKELKALGERSDGRIEIGDVSYCGRELAQKLLQFKKGRKITYVVDTVFSPETLERIRELAWESDDFYCECSYLQEDAGKAAVNHHLTAAQAGILARESRVKKLIPIHFSKRYDRRYDDFLREAGGEFPFVHLESKGV